jgi:hypothetical protein
MPVTAKLSRRFYERLGDEIANELVEWFNAVDATYRSDLRETNEANFARFMASVDQRFAEADARLVKRFGEQEAKFEKRFGELDAKFEKRFVEQDAKFEKRFSEQDAKFEKRFAELDVRLEKRFGDMQALMADFRTDIMKWMFVYWTGTMVALAGFVFVMLQRG